MVIAGPGTGKTQILTLRIANILRRTDVGPGNILAITFTEAGASSMRNRLVEMIGAQGYEVRIETFHGFCNNIIREYAEYFPHLSARKSATEAEQIAIITGIITSLKLKELKPYGNPTHYLMNILKAISDLKREGVGVAQFAAIIEQDEKNFQNIEDLYHEQGSYQGQMKSQYQRLARNIKKNKELAKIYRSYQSELKKRGSYDYNDMIVEVVGELGKNSELLLTLQEQYQYILVDEHQDTNNAQNKLLRLLTSFHSQPNLFIVGDQKQAIFRFQGASIENFNYFRKLYPKAKLIILEKNYRSGQAILDAAHGVIPSEKKLRASESRRTCKISSAALSSPEVEAYYIARQIQDLIKKDIAPEEIAVLYRDNKDAYPLARMLEKIGISFVIESSQNVLLDPEVKKLITLFRAVASFGTDETLAHALHVDFLNIPPLDIYQLLITAAKEKKSLHDLIRNSRSSALRDFYNILTRWEILQHNANLPEVFETITKESGFLGQLLSKTGMTTKLDYLNALFGEVKNLTDRNHDATLSDFLNHLAILETHNLLTRREISDGTGKVRLMTAHGAKGKEFEMVFIANAHDGHWGNRRIADKIILPEVIFSPSGSKLGEAGIDDDERRLFYVALTRAKRKIHISYPKKGLGGKGQLPSRFVSEIKPNLIDEINTDKYEKEYILDQEKLFGQGPQNGTGAKSKELVRGLFKENGLSVTGLNNYLACPWKYFYTNLLRIPEAKSKPQMYGTAIHAALKDFYKTSTKIKVTKKFLLKRFEDYLKKEPLRLADFKETLMKGKKALSGYYDTIPKPTGEILTEFKVKGIVLDKNLSINGQIDKVEFLDGTDVRVIDYKTSKPKSRNEIEGKTANSNGDIKRQLVFYKLLLDHYQNGAKFNMKEGVIEFIEPDQSGRYRKESFLVENKEVEELKKLVKQTAKEILNLSFWDKFCDDKDCEYCALRKLME